MRRHTRWTGDWSSDVCSSDLNANCNVNANYNQSDTNVTVDVSVADQTALCSQPSAIDMSNLSIEMPDNQGIANLRSEERREGKRVDQGGSGRITQHSGYKSN